MKSFREFLNEGNPLSRLHSHIKSGRHFATLSAQRPVGEVTPEENIKRHKELKHKLTQQGYQTKEVEGHWKGGKEKSILVYAKDIGEKSGRDLHRDMIQHGKDYNQDSILYHNGHKAKIHGTNEIGYPGKNNTKQIGNIHFNRPESENQTEMKPKSNNPLKPGRTSKANARFDMSFKK